MIQVIDDPLSGNVFGRLGKGIGQGLSETLPQEFKNQRLASGLESIGKQKGLTPLQQSAAFLRSGGSPEQLQQFLPILQQAQQRQAFQEKVGKEGGINVSEKPKSSTPNVVIPQENQPENLSGLASKAEIAQYKESALKEPTQQDIRALANDYLGQGLTNDVGQAMQMASQELRQNLASQQQNNAVLRTGINERIKMDLQGSGLNDYKEVSGEIKNQLLDQAEYLVNKGMSPKKAEEEISNIIKELGKTADKTKLTGSYSPGKLFRSSKDKTADLREQKINFEKYGFGEQFDDMAAAALGITPMKAAEVLDPIKNEKIKDALKPIKKHAGFVRDVTAPSPKKIDAIVKEITPKDNLLSIAYELRKGAVDVNEFKRRVRSAVDNGEIALTDRQKRQLERPISNSFLGDVFYEVF